MNKNMKITLLLLALGANFGLNASARDFEQPEPRTTEPTLTREEQELRDKEIELRMENSMVKRNERNRSFDYSHDYAYSPDLDQQYGRQSTGIKLEFNRPGIGERIMTFFKDLWGRIRLGTTPRTEIVSNQLNAHHVKSSTTPALTDAGKEAFKNLDDYQQEDALNEWLKTEVKMHNDAIALQNQTQKAHEEEFNTLKNSIQEKIAIDLKEIDTLTAELKTNENKPDSPAKQTQKILLSSRINSLRKNIELSNTTLENNEHQMKLDNLNTRINLQKGYNARIDAFVQEIQPLLANNIELKYNVGTYPQPPQFEFYDKAASQMARSQQDSERYRQSSDYTGPSSDTLRRQQISRTGDVLDDEFTRNAFQPERPIRQTPAQSRTISRETTIENLTNRLNNEKFSLLPERDRLETIKQALDNYDSLPTTEKEFTLRMLLDNKLISELPLNYQRKAKTFIDTSDKNRSLNLPSTPASLESGNSSLFSVRPPDRESPLDRASSDISSINLPESRSSSFASASSTPALSEPVTPRTSSGSSDFASTSSTGAERSIFAEPSDAELAAKQMRQRLGIGD